MAKKRNTRAYTVWVTVDDPKTHFSTNEIKSMISNAISTQYIADTGNTDCKVEVRRDYFGKD